MSKTEFTASANVRLTVEVMNLGPYGEGWTADKIHEQTEREAVEELTRIILAGQKEVPGCSRAFGLTRRRLIPRGTQTALARATVSGSH
jgi:hypothetical protein